MKQEGIYTHLSFYFPLWFYLDGDRRPFMLLFFDREMQEIYAAWADQLLNTKNPYTELTLGQDPAVAIVELINEDSHFFWTFGKKNMPEIRWQDFTQQYGEWLKTKYGSLDEALAAWGGVREPGDDPGQGRMELYGAWEMTTDGIRANPKRQPRLSDQVQFLTVNMRSFYERVISYLRRRCSYEGLISCGNWHVADPAKLDALERYCYTAGDVIDHHGYFDHGHEGDAAGYSVRPGQTFTSQSALHLQQPNPIPYVETEGYPHIISEIGWPMPNMYRSEFTFLTSTYGALQGLDGIYSFAIGSAGWDQQISKFPLSTPTTLGCFPAAALVYRLGYVREAPAVVVDHLAMEDLYALKGTSVYVAPAYDQFRAPAASARVASRDSVGVIDPATFYVGRVARNFDGEREKSYRQDLSQLIDHNKKIVQSVTGELALDYGLGLATMNTAKAQGAAGFLGRAGRISLSNVAIDVKNDYGTVTVVALDDQPIASSRRLLIQCMTVEQFYGFKTGDPQNLHGRIESVGSAPCGVERFDAEVTLRLEETGSVTVVACDEHGYPRKCRSTVPARRRVLRSSSIPPRHTMW